MGLTLSRAPVHRGLFRWTLEAAVLLGIGGAMFSTCFVEGVIVPVVVTSGSMAPALLGPHRTAECPDCGMRFAYDVEMMTDSAPTATCPNCGHQAAPTSAQPSPGDRLIIDRATFALRAPRRWEIALFRCPDCASDYCVKRIVGLPGETIDIRAGDVYVNGQIARKTLAEQRAMAIVVHDTAWSGVGDQVSGVGEKRPQAVARSLSLWERAGVRAAQPTRWQFTSGWRATGIGYTLDRSPTPHSLEFAGPIHDDDAYNPQSSRQLNDVADLMLVAKVSADGPGQLLIVARQGQVEYQVTLRPSAGELKLDCDGKTVATANIDRDCLRRSTELIVSMIDRQIVVAIDGQPEFTYPIEQLTESGGLTNRPFEVAAEDLRVQIDRLQIWRDVYVTPPANPNAATVCKLADGEYFALGDNSPASLDSRSWTGGAPFNERLLIGKPLSHFRRER
jgi:signal peptidase I